MLAVKKDYETARNKAFTVVNSENNKKHSVLFKIDKNEWSCDCKWNSLKETHCSHIKAVISKLDKEKVKSLIKNLGV
ncbi:MAG: hypothetical protein JW791_01955 [Nanoarchaeota archaeon]|nr:hypothetical protein [Nanoarchaeota archaeon]